jgi:predicted HTH domain antitoxin
MKTVSLSTRLNPSEAEEIDALAARAGLDRSAFLKQLIRRGKREVAFEQACLAYRSGQVSLSRAAEMAGISLREAMRLLPNSSTELNYQAQDLVDDLQGVSRP